VAALKKCTLAISYNPTTLSYHKQIYCLFIVYLSRKRYHKRTMNALRRCERDTYERPKWFHVGRYHQKSSLLTKPVRSLYIASQGSKAYTFLNVAVTLPKIRVSPSLRGVALSGSRRVPLRRVPLVLLRSVTV
jgi:hypothetical protein